MEVVQSGPLVCASRPSSSHPPPHPRLVHRLDGDPTSALHVQTEEGGGGLDPGWWKISASGSWDNGERRMRYGKLIDDRPGEIPGAVQRRKLEMLETHAPGASMRVVHSQSTASWIQDPNTTNSSALSSSISNSRRSVHASSSSSTRVTSFRQWSSNFSQNSSNNIGIKHETRPAITEFGNLELDLNPLDVSFLRTRGNVGRSGSIGSRRPPSRGRRASSEAPLGSPESEDGSKTPSPIPRLESSGIKIHDISIDGGEEFIESFSKGADSRSEWNPTASPVEPDSEDRRESGKSYYSTPRLQTVLHRKRSVSSEDLRAAEDGEEEDASSEDPEEKWRRGAVVRRSLPSSEWRSVVGAADEMRQRLRPRDPFKSSSVPALGCSNASSSSSRRGSFVTAESLREMKGRLKHRGGTSDAVLRPKAIEPKSCESGTLSSKDGGEETSTPRASPFFLRASATRENSLGGRQQHQQQDAQDDRRKSWSVGCRNLVKRGVEEESEGTSSRRRSYAFEYSVEEDGSSEEKENLSVVRQLQEGRGDAQRGKLRVDQQPYLYNRVNEVLKKWSALSKGEEEENKEEAPKSSDSSPVVIRRNFEEEECSVKNSTTWLDHKESHSNSAAIDVSDFSPASMSSGGRTTLRVIQSKSPNYKDDTLSEGCGLEKGIPESSFSVMSESMEDYMSTHGLAPIDWTENESRASKEIVKNETKANPSAGISVIFSNADGEHNVRHHCSVTHLENRDCDALKTESQGFKIRSSKKVEFSKTEVHFAAESGRFHIVETAGKPPPSNNFRRRRRSPTGTLNVDSGSRLGSGVASPSNVTNGMRFGDSPYEMRLLAGTDNLDISSRRNEEDYSNGQGMMDDHTTNGDNSLEYTNVTNSKAKVYNDLVIDEEMETKEVQKNTLDCEATNSSSTFLHLGLDDITSEKPRSILRSVAAESSPQWKTQKDADDIDNEDFKPKFGGVRLRPVVSPVSHSTINVTNQETSDILGTSAMDKSINDSLSPGQMELQKLLRSLRHVSMTYNENPNTSSIQIANGGGMEVRISSGSQAPVSNTVIIGNDPTNAHTPLSVAQRVREVEERRQKELSSRLSANPRPMTRATGQFSTRVTLGSGSSSVVSLESQVPRKTSVSQIESAKPVSPKPAAKLSTNNKITRIHSTQDKVGQLHVVRKGIREEIRRQERTQNMMTSEERALKPEATIIPPPSIATVIPLRGGRESIPPASSQVVKSMLPHEDCKKRTPVDAEGLWRGNRPPTPSASWPSARGLGRVGDDRVMLKSPSLILQTMLITAFSTIDKEETVAPLVVDTLKEFEVTSQVDNIEGIVTEKQNDTLMSVDKLQPKLSILRAMYRDASEEEGSDAAGNDGEAYVNSLGSLGEDGAGGLKLGDGGSVVSGSWRRLRRSKQPPKKQVDRTSPIPKPVPRRQGQNAVRAKERPAAAQDEPPMPPPRTRNCVQRVKRRSDGRGAGGRERVQERRRTGGGRGGECGGKGVASGLIGDSLHHSEVSTSSEIKISARLTENHPEVMDHTPDIPRVTRIALGFQDKAKDGARHTDPKTDFTAKVGAVHSAVVGCKLETSLREKPERIASQADETNVETREKNMQETAHSRQAKYKFSSSSKDIASGWRCIEVKDKKDEDLGRSDPVVKGVRSQKRVKQITSNIVEKSLTANFLPLNSPSADNKGFPSDVANFETVKDESRIEDVTEKFSIKMKVIKKQADEEKAMAIQNSSSPAQSKTTSQYDYLQHRTNINTLTSTTKLPESEGSGAQKNKKEVISRSDSKKEAMQALKSPTMNHRNRLNAGSSLTVTPETSSPSSGRAVRKRLRKRSSGGSSSKVPSTSERKREGHDEESTILEELTKAADEILHAVNGYSDEASSDEDIEASKNETRSKRKPPSKKDSVSRKISSSGRESKGVGSQRGSISKSRESKTRVSNGIKTTSAEAVQVPLPEVPTAVPESQRTSRGTRVASPVTSISSTTANSGSRGGIVSAISEKSQKPKQQQQVVGSSRKGMTRIEPTNRVPEVKLIEKRPPLPPNGQRRAVGTKERSEAQVRGTHGKSKTTTSLVYNKDGDAEVIKEVKRPLNIARALEAVMPDSRTKTRKIDQKVDAASIVKISEAQKKEGSSTNPASAQSSPGTSNSIERKKVASSRDGDKTTRRHIHQNIISPT